MSWEYILLSIFKLKTAFLAFKKLLNAWNQAVFAQFLYIPGSYEVLFDFFDSLHHHPPAGHSPPNTVGATRLAGATALARSLSNAILGMFYKH